MDVVITGTSRGIGLELTRHALTNGDRVFAIARDPAESEGLTQLKREFRDSLFTHALDLRLPTALKSLNSGLESWPRIDVLINNAGIYLKGETLEDFLSSFHVNSVAPFLVTKALLPKLRKASEPKAVQMTSLMGSIADNASGGSYAYRASKSALNMINKSLAVENEWLTTIVMHPGWVQTDMGGSAAPTSKEESAGGIWNVVRGLKPSDTGKFFDYRGRILPW